jgi:signal-transduction protein with cAMP-binding, CBS, and nucleotidyltransferase domain
MQIIDIPEYKDRKNLLIMEQATPVLDAVAKMKTLNCGSVMVTCDSKLCGIFTERDLLMRVVAANLDLTSLKLEDVMTKDVQTAKAHDGIYESMERMTTGHFRHLPVINNSGQVIGMVSQRDFVAITWQQLFEQLKNKTKYSFLSFSSTWMLTLGMLLYSALIAAIFSWLKK